MKNRERNNPRVSVITVCYNSREPLARTIENVASQRYDDMEYIVVDGGSSDGSVDLIKGHADVIDRWVSEPDGGIYDAMNKGVAMATGDFVIFMNAGDLFASPDTLTNLFNSIGPDSRSADVIYGDVIKDGVVKRAGEMRNCHRMFFCHQSCLARRERLAETPFDTSHRMSADFKWVKCMIRQGRRFVKADMPIADFDTTGVSNTSRSKGLLDNIKVVNEVDSLSDRVRLLPHLVFPYIICRMRGK